MGRCLAALVRGHREPWDACARYLGRRVSQRALRIAGASARLSAMVSRWSCRPILPAFVARNGLRRLRLSIAARPFAFEHAPHYLKPVFGHAVVARHDVEVDAVDKLTHRDQVQRARRRAPSHRRGHLTGTTPSHACPRTRCVALGPFRDTNPHSGVICAPASPTAGGTVTLREAACEEPIQGETGRWRR